MDDIILKYFEKNFIVTLDTTKKYTLFSRMELKDLGLKIILKEIEIIFSVPMERVLEVFDSWSEYKLIDLNNKIVEFQEKIFKETGQTIQPDDFFHFYDFD